MHNPTKKGEWVTNVPRSVKGYWPRRDAKYSQGDPKGSDKFPVEKLKELKIVGVYLDEDIPDGIKSRRLLKSPKDK